MTKLRLDQALVARGLVPTRSQAEHYIHLGEVMVNQKMVTKSGGVVGPGDTIVVRATERYVSRAGIKLASVASVLHLNFRGEVVLDVGSSTGGFSDYALQHGARKVVAVDVGTNQLHQSLRGDARLELHEKTDIRDFQTSERFDIVLVDVSFISIKVILPVVARMISPDAIIVAMVKPQFEATAARVKHKGVIKNDRLRRDIFKNFELWVKDRFRTVDQADASVPGAKGNRERFYVLKRG